MYTHSRDERIAPVNRVHAARKMTPTKAPCCDETVASNCADSCSRLCYRMNCRSILATGLSTVTYRNRCFIFLLGVLLSTIISVGYAEAFAIVEKMITCIFIERSLRPINRGAPFGERHTCPHESIRHHCNHASSNYCDPCFASSLRHPIGFG